jgi:hypothetical protein
MYFFQKIFHSVQPIYPVSIFNSNLIPSYVDVINCEKKCCRKELPTSEAVEENSSGVRLDYPILGSLSAMDVIHHLISKGILISSHICFVSVYMRKSMYVSKVVQTAKVNFIEDNIYGVN